MTEDNSEWMSIGEFERLLEVAKNHLTGLTLPIKGVVVEGATSLGMYMPFFLMNNDEGKLEIEWPVPSDWLNSLGLVRPVLLILFEQAKPGMRVIREDGRVVYDDNPNNPILSDNLEPIRLRDFC